MPKGLKGFQPGQSGNPNGRPEGAKSKTTLLKEERRALFDQEVESMFIDAIRKARPEYLLDQYLGKAPDIIQADVAVTGSIAADVLALAEEELKKRKLHEPQAEAPQME